MDEGGGQGLRGDLGDKRRVISIWWELKNLSKFHLDELMTCDE